MGSTRPPRCSDRLRPWFRSGIRSGSFWSRWPAGSTSNSATSSTICKRRPPVRVRLTAHARVVRSREPPNGGALANLDHHVSRGTIASILNNSLTTAPCPEVPKYHCGHDRRTAHAAHLAAPPLRSPHRCSPPVRGERCRPSGTQNFERSGVHRFVFQPFDGVRTDAGQQYASSFDATNIQVESLPELSLPTRRGRPLLKCSCTVASRLILLL